MERKRFIRVPKNKKAMEDYNYGIQNKGQMEELVLSEEQYKILDDMGVFEAINKKCGIIIDDYEEEVLELEKLFEAQEVVTQFINGNKNEELIKLKEMFDLAVSNKTIVGFDF